MTFPTKKHFLFLFVTVLDHHTVQKSSRDMVNKQWADTQSLCDTWTHHHSETPPRSCARVSEQIGEPSTHFISTISQKAKHKNSKHTCDPSLLLESARKCCVIEENRKRTVMSTLKSTHGFK